MVGGVRRQVQSKKGMVNQKPRWGTGRAHGTKGGGVRREEREPQTARVKGGRRVEGDGPGVTGKTPARTRGVNTKSLEVVKGGTNVRGELATAKSVSYRGKKQKWTPQARYNSMEKKERKKTDEGEDGKKKN